MKIQRNRRTLHTIGPGLTQVTSSYFAIPKNISHNIL